MISLALATALALLPGRYVSADRRIEARVEQVTLGRLRVEIVGGGIPNGAGTAGDCALVVEGPAHAGRATLPAVPFDSLNHDVTLAELKHKPIAVDFLPVRGGLVITVSGVLPCGVGSSLDGRLIRESKQPGKTLVQK